MSDIDKKQHDELIEILDELIKIIVVMRKKEKDYVLAQSWEVQWLLRPEESEYVQSFR